MSPLSSAARSVPVPKDKKVCPECNKWGDVGNVGNNKYYCRRCCIEFVLKAGDVYVYSIGANGVISLIHLVKEDQD